MNFRCQKIHRRVFIPKSWLPNSVFTPLGFLLQVFYLGYFFRISFTDFAHRINDYSTLNDESLILSVVNWSLRAKAIGKNSGGENSMRWKLSGERLSTFVEILNFYGWIFMEPISPIFQFLNRKPTIFIFLKSII